MRLSRGARARLLRRALALPTAVLGLVVLGHGSALHAQSNTSWRLGWSAPRGCPTEAEVEERIRARLSTEDGAAVQAKVHVARRGSSFRVRIRLSGAVSAERVLDAESCDAAADATALLITLAIQPDAVAGPETLDGGATNTGASDSVDAAGQTGGGSTRGADSTNPAGVRKEPTENSPTDPGAADEEDDEGDGEDEAASAEQDSLDEGAIVTDGPTSPLQLTLDAGAGAAFDWGTLPGPSLGGLLQLNLTIERVLLSLSGGLWLPRSAGIGSDASVAVGWIAAGLDGCYLSGSTLQLGPCLGVELGRYTWDAQGLLNADAGQQLAAFASATITARARLTNALYAALWVGVRSSVSYPQLLVVGVGEAFSPAPIGFRAAFFVTLVLG